MSDYPQRTLNTAMAGVAVTMLMSALDQTIVSTALPRVIAELHGFQHYSGTITAYMVASTSAVPIAGKLSDFYGRKPLLLIGVAIFVLASALCGSAQDMLQLIGYRGIQGLGAGICQAMAFTTIADFYPPAERGRVSGMMGAVFGLSSVIGPALGGFLTDGPGWRYVFFVNLPIGITAFLVLLFYFPKITLTEKLKPEIDYAGIVTLVSSVVPILLALSWGGRDYSWGSPVILSLLGFGLILAALFLYCEAHAKQPIIPLHLFRERLVWVSMLVSALIAIGMFGTTLFIPLYIQTVIGTSATRSGAVMMPMSLTMVLSAVLTGQLISHLGKYRFLAVGGVFVTTIAMILLAKMDLQTPYSTVVCNLILMGLGLGTTMPVFTLAVQNVVPLKFVGTATSTVQFVRSVGGALGAAIFGSLLANLYPVAFRMRLNPAETAKIPLASMGELSNPQFLTQPHAFDSLQNSFNPEIFAHLRLAARIGLSEALHTVFLCGAGLLTLATLASLLIKDIPLRKSNRAQTIEP